MYCLEVCVLNVSFFFDVLTSFNSVFKRVSFSRILFSFYDEPAIIIAVIDDVENRFEINIAVARNREHASTNAVEEAHVFRFNFVADVHTNVFQMDVTNTGQVFFKDCQVILAGA